MKKIIFAALMVVATLAQANTCTLFSNTSGNNYSCSLPVNTGGQDITTCSFTFNSVYCPSTLFCNLLGNSSSCNVGFQQGSCNTWTCTLNSTCLNYLNNCLGSGNNCSFNLNCWGGWNIGCCQCDYTCGGTPHNSVPDTFTTVLMLGLTLLGLEVSRRKLVPARAQK
jgi:hypothetical protein